MSRKSVQRFCDNDMHENKNLSASHEAGRTRRALGPRPLAGFTAFPALGTCERHAKAAKVASIFPAQANA
ncbi:MAG: hypothetical protein EOR03_32995 [Mesorhizobium sp.]|nr:MAG: hypothetical protein EOR03_32995 [Mesorhizobium sp.]